MGYQPLVEAHREFANSLTARMIASGYWGFRVAGSMSVGSSLIESADLAVGAAGQAFLTPDRGDG
jgi:hypothetical protein